ncbi:MAG: glycosyltransferase [Gemmatimonadaceae bacterium]
MRASLVIPTRNRARIIALTLPHMLRQTVDDCEVIVVDDGSTDDTSGAVRQSGEGRAIYCHVPQGGASAARNRALAIATGEVIVFVDDDAFIAPDFVARHLACHERTATALVAGGIRDVDQVPEADTIARVGRSRTYHRHPMPGGNASVKRAHLLASGGFDEAFNAYGWQDQELAERLLCMGLVRRFAWGATILHYRPASVVLDARHELERELERGRMGARFYRKHPRTLIGITTKLWPPLRALDHLLTAPLGLEKLARRILAGEAVMPVFRGVRASLVRAHVEISAGRRELSRIDALRNGSVSNPSGAHQR